MQPIKVALYAVGLFLILLAAAAVGGCGSGEVAASRPGIARAALIGPSDFGNAVVVEDGLPQEPCGPVRIFRENRGQGAETQMFSFHGLRVQEAVGSFPQKGLATSAYGVLVSSRHRECIGRAMANYARPKDLVRVLRFQPLEAGDRARLFRVHVTGPKGEQRGAAAVVAIRSNRCVIALILLANRSNPVQTETGKVISTAVRSLVRACGRS